MNRIRFSGFARADDRQLSPVQAALAGAGAKLRPSSRPRTSMVRRRMVRGIVVFPVCSGWGRFRPVIDHHVAPELGAIAEFLVHFLAYSWMHPARTVRARRSWLCPEMQPLSTVVREGPFLVEIVG
jgi:hypothetical protein